MDLAQKEIDDLDKALAEAGATVIFRRYFGGSHIDKSTLAHIRLFRPNKLVQTAVQIERRLIISPTDFDKAPMWPVIPGGGIYPTDSDKVLFEDVRYNIEAALPMYAYGRVVRLEIRILGGG